jgi:hypothetical protein
MADYTLIDTYLDVVGRRLAHRSDANDLHDELADHLFESAERAEKGGLDGESAQRATLDRFGDPHVVAALLAAVPTKGIDMVHTLGRSAGILTLGAAALWLGVVLFGPFGLVGYLDPSWSTNGYVVQRTVQGVAVVVSGLAFVAQNLRVAHRVDGLGGLVIGAMLIASVLAVGFSWMFFSWGVYFAVGLAITISQAGRERVGRGAVPALLLVIAPILLVAGSLAALQMTGAIGDRPLTSVAFQQLNSALLVANVFVCLALAVGFALLGARLHGGRVLGTDLPAAVA